MIFRKKEVKDRHYLIDKIWPLSHQSKILRASIELDPKTNKPYISWTRTLDDCKKAIQKWKENKLKDLGLSRIGLVAHQTTLVHYFALDLDDHRNEKGEGKNNLPLLNTYKKFLGGDPLIFSTKSGKGVRVFYLLESPVSYDYFQEWRKSWMFNKGDFCEVFPKSGKSDAFTGFYIPNDPNGEADKYISGSWDTSTIVLPPIIPFRPSLRVCEFLLGVTPNGNRGDTLNVVASSFAEHRIERELARKWCYKGYLLTEKGDPYPFETQFESGYKYGLSLNAIKPEIEVFNEEIEIKNYLDNIPESILLLKDKHDHPEKYKGVPSGFKIIDSATNGWQKSRLYIVLGRPGMGKSVLLLNFAYNAYMQDCNIVYVTIEMPIDEQEERTNSITSLIEYEKIYKPHLMSEDEIRIFEKKLQDIKELRKNNLTFVDIKKNCTAETIDVALSKVENKNNKKIDLLIIDPIYLMHPVNKDFKDLVGEISWDLKTLARSREIPIIVASQINREGHKRNQKKGGTDTADAAFSDKLAYNSDGMLHMIGEKDSPIVELEFSKFRHAKINKTKLIKRYEFMTFKEFEEQTIIEKDTE